MNTMGRPLNIAVAGAGIGGLASAALLSRAGHTVRIFDQFAEPSAVGSGLMLQRTGLAVLERLGVGQDINALGSPIDRLWGLTTPSLRPVLDVRFKSLSKTLYGLGILRPVLFDRLLNSAIESGAELVPATHIRDVDIAAGVLVTHRGRRFGPFDLIVDALGVRSPLSSPPKRRLPYGALWATLPWPEDGPFDKTALEQRYRAARRMAGVMPSGRSAPGARLSLTYFWSIRADRESVWQGTPLAAWKEKAAALWPETASLLEQLSSHTDLTFTRYRHRTHPNPIEGGRLVHIGDAWHAASPQLGQGANMALLDAWALALAINNTTDLPAALKAYRSSRTAHVRLYQRITWLFTPVYQGDSRILPFFRDWLAAPLSRIWPAPQLLAAMVSGGLGSPLRKLDLKSKSE